MSVLPAGSPELIASWEPEDEPRLLGLLQEGELTVQGLLSWGSNYVFLGQVEGAASTITVVYKPIRGERPLIDFPRGSLAGREVAAYRLNQFLGWSLIPPTLLRDGPYGPGSVQLFLNVDQDAHFFNFNTDQAEVRPVLMALAAFDLVANNADRKAGHCLRLSKDRIVAIDHGLCFHVKPKLRTVIWDYAGTPLPAEIRAALGELADPGARRSELTRALSSFLSLAEVDALQVRAAVLLESGVYPFPPDDRRPYPWPPI